MNFFVMNNILKDFNSKTIALLGVVKENEHNEREVLFLGTCFKIYQNYYLTCFHVLDLSKQLVISFPNEIDGFFDVAKKQKFQCADIRLIAKDTRNDIALIKVNGNYLHFGHENKPVDILETNLKDIGNDVVYAGYPFCHQEMTSLKWSKTIISSKILSPKKTKQYMLDSVVHQGNSGGPLIDLNTGKVVGIISMTYNPMFGAGIMFGNQPLSSTTSLGMAISIIHAINLLKSVNIYE